MDSAAIKKQLAEELPGWQVCSEGVVIHKVFATTGWKSSMLIANAIGLLAEAGWHHPQIVINYSSVIVNLTTHSEGCITPVASGYSILAHDLNN